MTADSSDHTQQLMWEDMVTDNAHLPMLVLTKGTQTCRCGGDLARRQIYWLDGQPMCLAIFDAVHSSS